MSDDPQAIGSDNHENSLHSVIIKVRRRGPWSCSNPWPSRSKQAESLRCQRDRAVRYRTEAAFASLVQLAQKAAGGRSFHTGGGKVVAIEGAAAPKSVAISEWDSLEQAQAFYNSPAWNALTPYRNKAIKTIRRYVVEARD